jgi:hypothetical protein
MNTGVTDGDSKNRHQKPQIPIPTKTKASLNGFVSSSQSLSPQFLHRFDAIVFQTVHLDTGCEHEGQRFRPIPPFTRKSSFTDDGLYGFISCIAIRTNDGGNEAAPKNLCFKNRHLRLPFNT